ncbi:MAG: NAD(P)-dependent oxidoreductase [Bacteroidales bacterium]|nr:NAD(P)-dependent oxidoreductase [Bacteroidales bacterium]MDY0216734.1 NAD(P)-dependent oxidoreductase [Bacteroidales bacterium]
MKIVIAEPIGISPSVLREFRKNLENSGHELIAFEVRPENDLELLNRLRSAEIVVVSNLSISGEIIQQCEKLKLIAVAFTGIDHIDVETCKKQKIQICNAAGYSTVAVSELTIGLIMDALRKITELHYETINGGTRKQFLGTELSGKTVGIVGTGDIGGKVAEILTAFGCKVLAYSRTHKAKLIKIGVKYVDLDLLLNESDIVTIHVPHIPETNLMFNKESFSKMKTASYFINTARGKVVDSYALADALKSGKLSGAAVDVYEYEPPIQKDHPLLSAPNIVLTPHIAFATKEAIEKRSKIVINNILTWLDGNPENICL